MFISNKQKNKPLQKAVVVYSILMLSVLFLSCGDSSGKEADVHVLPHSDGLKIKAENIFRIYISKVTAVNGRDSVMLVLDRNSSLLYKVDTSNKILAVDTLPQKITNDLIAFTYQDGRYYVLYENALKIFSVGGFSTSPKTYTFNNIDVYAYHSMASEFKVNRDQTFLIYCVPKFNDLINAAGRTKYFNSKVVHKGIIDEEREIVNTTPIQEITFTEGYKKSYYNDLFPDICSFGDSIAYTLQHCDSLNLIMGDEKQYYRIPGQFSVAAEPIPESHVQSRSELSAYSAIHTYNCKLLKLNQKILLFQAIGADNYYNEETGMLNDFLSRKKRIIVFDIIKKQFEAVAYDLPANCAPVKSYIFNGKLILFSTDETRRKISILPVTL